MLWLHPRYKWRLKKRFLVTIPQKKWLILDSENASEKLSFGKDNINRRISVHFHFIDGYRSSFIHYSSVAQKDTFSFIIKVMV